MIDQLSIAISTEDDIACLSTTLIDAFEEDRVLYGEAPYGDNPERELVDQLSKNQCYTIKLGSHIIGGMYVGKIGDCSYRLKRLWIDKANQNNGNGSKILKLLEESLENLQVLSLDTPYKSYRNHHFYEKNGFRKTGERKIVVKEMINLDPNFILFEYTKTYNSM